MLSSSDDLASVLFQCKDAMGKAGFTVRLSLVLFNLCLCRTMVGSTVSAPDILLGCQSKCCSAEASSNTTVICDNILRRQPRKRSS
jgi:hypothetical protein